jgi:hypothetical protein
MAYYLGAKVGFPLTFWPHPISDRRHTWCALARIFHLRGGETSEA